MKLVDVNLLIYAVDEASPRHTEANAWLTKLLAGPETVALSWHALLGFVRLSTRAQVFSAAMTVDEALDTVDAWLAQPAAVIVQETPRHLAVMRHLLAPLGAGGNLTSDAHLAALAIEHGAELCSCDADFSRFPGLRWRDPLRG